MTVRRFHPLLAALTALTLGALACSQGESAHVAVDPDTLTRRQKDSIISTMPIPGARGVGRALDASDAAAARVRRFDSLAAGN